MYAYKLFVDGQKPIKVKLHRTFQVGDPFRVDGTPCIVHKVDFMDFDNPVHVFLRPANV